MAKQEAEWSNRFSISFLRKHGYLNPECSYQSGGIKWTHGTNDEGSSIGFSVQKENWGTPQETAHIKLKYTHTSRDTGEKEDMDFRVELITTPCNFGGKRYWFVCPLSKNGFYCGRRVGVLFGIGKWFGCRHCGEIAYASQMEGGRFRWNGVSAPDVDRAKDEIKRYYYKGKPTRRYKRYLRLVDKFDAGLMMMVARVDKRFSQFVPNKK